MCGWLYSLVSALVVMRACSTLFPGLRRAELTVGLDLGMDDKPTGAQTTHTLQHERTELAQVVEIMPVQQLNPTHYPARRAAVVAQHFINTRYGSPYKYFMLDQVHKATKEEVEGVGMKYNVEFSVKEVVGNCSAGLCSAEVLFPQEGEQTEPQVQCSCDGLPAVLTSDKEEELYLKLSSADALLSGNDIPDSHGYIAPEMNPMWMLASSASSFIMLKESNESTLFSIAQLANITQQESENAQLMFRFHVLLHELVSQEIIHWKLLASWSPAGGVQVHHTEWQPKCDHCIMPPAGNSSTLLPRN